MKAIILAGGVSSRLSEETHLKPVVEIGGKPILWHIMNIFSTLGVQEFIVALGYRADVVKTYFLNFYALNSDISIDLATGTGGTDIRNGRQTNWKVHLGSALEIATTSPASGRVSRKNTTKSAHIWHSGARCHARQLLNSLDFLQLSGTSFY